MTACLGVSLRAPHSQLGEIPGTPARARKAFSPIASMRRCVAIVLSAPVSSLYSCSQVVAHGVCHTGSLLPRLLFSHSFFQRSWNQWSSSGDVSALRNLRDPAYWFGRCCCSCCSVVALYASAPGLVFPYCAAVFVCLLVGPAVGCLAAGCPSHPAIRLHLSLINLSAPVLLLWVTCLRACRVM